MKNSFLSTAPVCAQSFRAAIACFVLLAIFSASASAQANNPNALPAVVSTVDLAGVKWKPVAEFSDVVAAERAVAAQHIGTPGLPAPELALYTGYDLMLSYIQDDLGAGLPLEGMANNSFKKVVSEMGANPALEQMGMAEFTSIFGSLVPKLTDN